MNQSIEEFLLKNKYNTLITNIKVVIEKIKMYENFNRDLLNELINLYPEYMI